MSEHVSLQPGFAGLHLLRHETPSIAPTEEQKIRRNADRTADWVLVACGYVADALRALSERELSSDSLVEMGATPGAERGLYALSCSATPFDVADVSAITTASTISESSMAVEDDDTDRGAERVRASASWSVGATNLHLFARKPRDVVEPGDLKNDSCRTCVTRGPPDGRPNDRGLATSLHFAPAVVAIAIVVSRFYLPSIARKAGNP